MHIVILNAFIGYNNSFLFVFVLAYLASLKRKLKAERAALIHEDEVKRSKEKFGHKRARESTEVAGACCRSVSRVSRSM